MKATPLSSRLASQQLDAVSEPEPTSAESVMQPDMEAQADLSQQSNPSLELVHEEAKYAFERLMSDITGLDERMVKQIEINLLIIGALLASLGTELSKAWSSQVKGVIGIAIAVLSLNVIINAITRVLQAEFPSGVIFPHLLQSRIEESPSEIRADLLQSLASSYYYNHQEFLRRGKFVRAAWFIQILVVIALVVAFAAEVFHIF